MSLCVPGLTGRQAAGDVGAVPGRSTRSKLDSSSARSCSARAASSAAVIRTCALKHTAHSTKSSWVHSWHAYIRPTQCSPQPPHRMASSNGVRSTSDSAQPRTSTSSSPSRHATVLRRLFALGRTSPPSPPGETLSLLSRLRRTPRTPPSSPGLTAFRIILIYLFRNPRDATGRREGAREFPAPVRRSSRAIERGRSRDRPRRTTPAAVRARV